MTSIFPVTLGHGDGLDALVFGLVGIHSLALAYWLISTLSDVCKNGLNLPRGKLSSRKAD